MGEDILPDEGWWECGEERRRGADVKRGKDLRDDRPQYDSAVMFGSIRLCA
jgi:hypothetical protein